MNAGTETPTPATAAWLAAQDFEPWVKTPGSWEPPTNDQWAHMGKNGLPFVRMAYLAMFKTKAELIQMIKEMNADNEGGFDLFENMADQIQTMAEFAEAIAGTCHGAHARLMCAVASMPGVAGPADQEKVGAVDIDNDRSRSPCEGA